jgi:signal transduction histidine kinase
LILAECKAKVLVFGGALAASPPSDGWALFYDDLVDLLLRGQPFEFHAEVGLHSEQVQKNAKDYVRLGYTVSEVVHSYGILSQSITEFAQRLHYTISQDEYAQIGQSLDVAIAEAVTEFERVKSEGQGEKETERLGFLAHELRNSLQSATIALQMIEDGSVGARSNTSVVLQNSLNRMAELIDTALTEVRMRVEPTPRMQRIRVFEILSEVGTTATFQARARNLTLHMQGFSDLEVNVDRQLIVSALANLVQNALKFTAAGGSVQVRTRLEGERVLIEVVDQCGGLPHRLLEDIFKPFTQESGDRTGLGLGLSISRRAIELNKGKLRVENLAGYGCVFIIDLPLAGLTSSPVAEHFIRMGTSFP